MTYDFPRLPELIKYINTYTGHLALMLGSYCYSVTCNNQRTCQTIPAKPSYLKPKVAYLAWTQEPIEEDTSKKDLDFFPYQ